MLLPRILAVLSLAASASAAGTYNAFLGCVIAGSSMVPLTATATGQTRAQCQSTCRTAKIVVNSLLVPADISMWSAQGNCYCANTMQATGLGASSTNTNTYYHNGDAYGNCMNGQDLTADYVLSNLRFEGCSSSSLGTASSTSTVSSQDTCIANCYGSGSTPLYNTATVIPSGTGYACSCYSSLYTSLPNTPSVCGPSSFFIYSTLQPGASYAQRKRSERLKAEKKLRGNTPCPKPLNACIVPGTMDYECIDTTNELESCGGCMAGYFESNRPSGGVNCAEIPGVAKHGVMCSDNRCVVSQCKFGWKLSEGKCEQMKTRHVAGKTEIRILGSSGRSSGGTTVS